VTPEAAAALPPATRVVLTAGMPRSGSTAVFNIARLLLERQGDPLTSGWIEDVTEPVQPTVLLKVHDWHLDLAHRAEVVLISHRDLRAVARSLAGMGWLWPEGSALDHLDSLVRTQAQWSTVSSLDLRYETMIQDWPTTAAQIASAIQIDLPRAELETIARQVATMPTEVPADRKYNPVTLLHRGHRREDRGDYDFLLIEAEIHRRFSDWQEAHGYR
jgi:hypothetical protein